jgi:hypothetical protein
MRCIACRRWLRNDGQILVVFAIAVVALILVTGLVIDGGNAFLNRRDAQSSSDIAAMAGTKRLADYYVTSQSLTATDNVYTAISTRMTENGCTPAASCSWTARYVGPRTAASFVDLGAVGAADTAPPGAISGQKALGVKVDVSKAPETYFLGIIGQGTWNIRTTATAITGQLPGAPAGQLLPIALVSPPTMVEGNVYALTSGSNGPGNFGWISWLGGNSAGTLSASLCTPDNPGFVLPAQFPGDPGKTNAAGVRACLQQWVDAQTTVLIPIVLKTNDPAGTPGCQTGGQGNGFTYCVVGIAAFVITSYAQPAVDQINGRFVATLPYSTGSTVPGGITAPPSTDSTFYLIGLAQ